MKIPKIYWDDEKAVRLLVEYVTDDAQAVTCSIPSVLRAPGRGRPEHVADHFDSNVLVAITALSVSLRPHGAINLLTDPSRPYQLAVRRNRGGWNP